MTEFAQQRKSNNVDLPPSPSEWTEVSLCVVLPPAVWCNKALCYHQCQKVLIRYSAIFIHSDYIQRKRVTIWQPENATFGNRAHSSVSLVLWLYLEWLNKIVRGNDVTGVIWLPQLCRFKLDLAWSRSVPKDVTFVLPCQSLFGFESRMKTESFGKQSVQFFILGIHFCRMTWNTISKVKQYSSGNSSPMLVASAYIDCVNVLEA